MIQRYETLPYPSIGLFARIKGELSGEERKQLAQTLNRNRQVLINLGARTQQQEKRLELLTEKIGLDLENRETLKSKFTALGESVAKLQDALAKALVKCNSESLLSLERCEQLVKEVQDLSKYDSTVLNLLPSKFYSWCVLGYATRSISADERLTVEGILEQGGLEGNRAWSLEENGEQINDFCLQAQEKTDTWESLDLSFDEISLPISSFLPITSIPSLKEIKVEDQGLEKISNLENLVNLETLSLRGQQFRQTR